MAKYPVIYEINTWVWLSELSRTHRRPVTLPRFPIRNGRPLPLMVLTRSGSWACGSGALPASPFRCGTRGSSRIFAGLFLTFRREDNVGSPYCVRRYVVDQHLGGPEGLALARKKLADRGLQLILDFVPNHVAPDHPWVTEHPDYFVQGSSDDLAQKPGEFFQTGGKVLALGRDPFFAPWPDVVQFNGFHPGLRKAIIETVGSIAGQCWQKEADRHLIIVNLSGVRSQTRVRLPWVDLAGHSWKLTDPLQRTVYDQAGDELQESGFYADLEPWGYHILHCAGG